MSLEIEWYFDFISPFAYIQARSFNDLSDYALIRPIPILFAGLLNHFGQKGPAEIVGKREHTYRYCHWYANKHGIPFKMPDAHPFNPLVILRLAILRASTIDEIIVLFRGVFEQGLLPSTKEYIQWVSAELGANLIIPNQWTSDVKEQLRLNTETAIDNQVFGVPTFRSDGMNFWGVDSMDMLKESLVLDIIISAPIQVFIPAISPNRINPKITA